MIAIDPSKIQAIYFSGTMVGPGEGQVVEAQEVRVSWEADGSEWSFPVEGTRWAFVVPLNASQSVVVPLDAVEGLTVSE